MIWVFGMMTAFGTLSVIVGIVLYLAGGDWT